VGVIHEAVDILLEWPDFAKDFKDPVHFHGRLHLPNRMGHMRIVTSDDGKRLMYTWTRLDEPCFTVPDERHWRKDGSMLWLCDMVWDKPMTARQAGNLYCNDMLDLGVGTEGEHVYFYRGYSGRYGYGILRRQPDVRRRQDTDRRKQPMEEHARLAEKQLSGAHAGG
jgi:hypothetical protein